MADALPGPLYVLTLDQEVDLTGKTKPTARVIYVTSGGKRYVAVFTREDRATAWVKENAARNTVLRPLPLADRDTILGFLADLARNGETDVCVDPPATGEQGRFVRVDQLAAIVGGLT